MLIQNSLTIPPPQQPQVHSLKSVGLFLLRKKKVLNENIH